MKAHGLVASFGTKQKGCHRSPCGSTECYQMSQTIQSICLTSESPSGRDWLMWVCGAILAGSGCQNAVATALSFVASFNTMRQYLREWLYDGAGPLQIHV